MTVLPPTFAYPPVSTPKRVSSKSPSFASQPLFFQNHSDSSSNKKQAPKMKLPHWASAALLIVSSWMTQIPSKAQAIVLPPKLVLPESLYPCYSQNTVAAVPSDTDRMEGLVRAVTPEQAGELCDTAVVQLYRGADWNQDGLPDRRGYVPPLEH